VSNAYFNSGASFAPNTYTLTYVSGAINYGSGWTVGMDSGHTFAISYDGGTIQYWPLTSLEVADVQVPANQTSALTFTTTTTAPIFMYIIDDTPLYNICGNFEGCPTFLLTPCYQDTPTSPPATNAQCLYTWFADYYCSTSEWAPVVQYSVPACYSNEELNTWIYLGKTNGVCQYVYYTAGEVGSGNCPYQPSLCTSAPSAPSLPESAFSCDCGDGLELKAEVKAPVKAPVRPITSTTSIRPAVAVRPNSDIKSVRGERVNKKGCGCSRRNSKT
jgi:hypothetical protein